MPSSRPFRGLSNLLKAPALFAFVFVFDGPERASVKRGAGVQVQRSLWWVGAAKDCGPTYALALARSGVGDGLYGRLKSAETDAEVKYTLDQWRLETLERLRLNPSLCPSGFRNAFEKAPPQFPTAGVVNNYLRPANSTPFPDYRPNTQAWKSVERPDVCGTLQFCRNRLSWSDATKLLKALRANVWEGWMLRMIYSPQCTWDSDEKAFGTSAHQLPTHACCMNCMKWRKVEGGDHGQLQARLAVREADVLDAFLGEESDFPSAKPDQHVIKVWAPAKMVHGQELIASERWAPSARGSLPRQGRAPPAAQQQTHLSEVEWPEPSGNLLGNPK
ncbi:hypothetical protein FA13DRAFT_1794599 [Coprinellus micaceus]|uniref:Uncharacterized protein n=1 Tax=Coprinellus micaceus TaxID=71717 RepID=A0A4Y7T1Y8_COPMI|nr:hypothetical protein FA13DRAFT_1794599 [Coprinellus micaceus]